MSVALTSNFFTNARGITLTDANGVTWSINKNTNSVTASVSGAQGGTVTNVGLVDGSTTPLYTITNSPVTVSGNLTFTLKTQSANLVLAGASTGAAAQPSFRALVVADLPGGYPYGELSGAPSIPAAANPTGTVGLATVNGSAATFLRSDGAPRIDQAIVPTWAGLHTFSASLRNKAQTTGTGPGGSTLTFDFPFAYAPGQLYLISRGGYDSTGAVYSHRVSVWAETSSGVFVESATRVMDAQGGSATVTTDTVTRSSGNIVVTVNISKTATTFTNYASVISLT